MSEHVKREQPAWVIVHDVPGQRVRRFAVAAGWLYQVELSNHTTDDSYGSSPRAERGWHPPVFVPHVP